MKTKKHELRSQNICSICGVGFEHPLVLEHHKFMDKCYPGFQVEKTTTHECSICNVKFTNTKDMVRHLSRNLHKKRRRNYSGEGLSDDEYKPPDFDNMDKPTRKMTSRQFANLAKKADFLNSEKSKKSSYSSSKKKTTIRTTEPLTEDQSTAHTASLLLECLTAINQGSSSVDSLVKNVHQEVEKNTVLASSSASESSTDDDEEDSSKNGPEKCDGCDEPASCVKCIAYNMWKIENFANTSNDSPKKKKRKDGGNNDEQISIKSTQKSMLK